MNSWKEDVDVEKRMCRAGFKLSKLHWKEDRGGSTRQACGLWPIIYYATGRSKSFTVRWGYWV